MHRSSRYFTQHFQQATSFQLLYIKVSPKNTLLKILFFYSIFRLGNDARISISPGFAFCLHQYVLLCPTAIHDVENKGIRFHAQLTIKETSLKRKVHLVKFLMCLSRCFAKCVSSELDFLRRENRLADL